MVQQVNGERLEIIMAASTEYKPQWFKSKARNSLLYAHIRVNLLKRPIRVWFWRSESVVNFGDELTPDIIKSIFKKDTVRVEPNEADLFAVGSIIEVANEHRKHSVYIWGSGYIEDGESFDNPNLRFKAVRGYMTKSRIPTKYNNIPVGDPGLLSNLVYERSSRVGSKVGIVPHFVDENDKLFDFVKNNADDYTIISPRSTPAEVVKQITECRLVLSSSLHGLIVADSFSVPNIHMPISDMVHGGDYKFRDYYSSIDREYQQFNKNDLYDKQKLEVVIDNYKSIVNLEDIQQNLIKSFPF